MLTQFLDRLCAYKVGQIIPLSHSFLEGKESEPGELVVDTPAEETHLLYRNRMEILPGVFMSGVLTDDAALIVVRDTRFQASKILDSLDAIRRHIGADHFIPDVRSYRAFVLYYVRIPLVL